MNLLLGRLARSDPSRYPFIVTTHSLYIKSACKFHFSVLRRIVHHISKPPQRFQIGTNNTHQLFEKPVFVQALKSSNGSWMGDCLLRVVG